MRFFSTFVKVTAVFFIIAASATTLSFAQSTNQTNKKTVNPYALSEDIDINGTLSNPVWDRAKVSFIEYELSPDDDAAAPVKTEVKLLYSKDHIYFGFIAYDPNPAKIRASISERDNVSGDDYLGVFLDTYGNRRQAYQFFVNPQGVQFDAFRSSNGEDASFDALWYSEATITDWGYTAVIKIPFKSLNFSDQQIQNWSVQFFRNYPRSIRHQLAWTDVNLDDACVLCQNGNLTGIQGIESVNTVEFLPYLTSFQSSTLNEAGDPASGLDHGPIKARAGGSVSYGPSSTASLNAVINPDFSQVETDAAQIGINESFALFFPEKRPFFLKESSLFETESELFYSRTINDPLAAAKITQNANRYSIAFLTAYDQSTPFIVPGLNQSANIKSDVNSYSNILRGKYDFGPETYIGGLLTTRNLADGGNYVGSIDWQLRLSDTYYTGGQLGYSFTQEPDDTSLINDPRRFGRSTNDAAFNGEQYGGSLIALNIERRAKYVNASVNYESFAPTFQAQNGFINQVNRRSLSFRNSLSSYPNRTWSSQASVSSFGSWRYDFTGQLQERFVNLSIRNQLAGQTSVGFSYLALNDERFRGQFFTGIRRGTIEVDSNPLKALSLGAELEVGRDIRRTRNPVLGTGYSISADATIKPVNRFQLDLSYNYSTLSSINGSEEFFSGDIMRMTGRFNFSREWFLRLITQYNSFSDQIQIYPLVNYELNPFTKFFAGMTDVLSRPRSMGGLNTYRQTNRQFFVKFQYLIRN